MSGPINIGSTAEWHSLLSGTNVVVADFYADWCGPCKMIAPVYENLAKQHSKPKRLAFAKVNVDNQSDIARSNGVSAMPTFKIFHGGECVETLKGANPSSLGAAITKAVKLSESTPAGKPTEVFSTPGRTLGGGGSGNSRAGSAAAGKKPQGSTATRSGGGFSLYGFINGIVLFVALYIVSLFSIDAMAAAENSMFNKREQAQFTKKRTAAANGNGSSKGSSSKTAGSSSSSSTGETRQAPTQRFRTLRDLSEE